MKVGKAEADATPVDQGISDGGGEGGDSTDYFIMNL